VGRRENHDSSDFYRRFRPPDLSDDDAVTPASAWPCVDQVIHGALPDRPDTVASASVALVVTSPPYYSGKEYEAAIGQGRVPASYEAYLRMLHGVFSACVTALEPGGRMAVNVANLGRKPYRSLSRDVIDLFEDLGLLLRGEIVWQKARGAAGNCAWGTYQRPGDPVLRDLTERIIVASKGRFDRAVDPRTRQIRGLPSEASISRDEFLEATTDVWELAPQSASRVNHPAPFPVELPQRLIDLYTYRGDLVLDPFMGSGTTAVAAVRTDRHYLGFDTDAGYVEAARARIDGERERRRPAETSVRPVLPAQAVAADPDEDFVVRGRREGRRAREVARWALEAGAAEGSDFEVTGEGHRLAARLEVDFVARDRAGGQWCFDVVGTFSATRGGLRRNDSLLKAVGKATVLHQLAPDLRYVLLSVDRPAPRSAGARMLDAVTGRHKPVFDVIDLGSDEDLARLRTYGRGRRR